MLEDTGYMEMLKDRNTPDDVARIENLEELSRAIAESKDPAKSSPTSSMPPLSSATPTNLKTSPASR